MSLVGTRPPTVDQTIRKKFNAEGNIAEGYSDIIMLKRLMEMFGRTPKNKKQNNISADVVNGDIIQDTELVNIKIQRIWIKNIKISNELKCCRFADPDQAYKDFIAAQQSEDKRIKIRLVPADEERKASRIAVFE